MTQPPTLRVAMVHGPGSPERDGVSGYVEHLCTHLRMAGVDAVPVPVRPDSARPSPAGWARATAAAGRRIRALSPDLVHVQFAPSAFGFSGVPGAMLPSAVPRGLPLITTVHEYGWWAAPSWVPARSWRAAERLGVWDRETGRLLPRSAAVVSTNRAHADAVARRTGRPPYVVPLAPNVDRTAVPADPALTRRTLGIPLQRTVLAFFGFVHPVKGLRYAIEALPRLVAEGEDPHLLVLGGFTSQALPEGEAARFRRELEECCRARGVADRVTFTGHLPGAQVSAALQAADLGLLPFTAGVSTKSGALLTLLRHGLATVVTRADPPDPLLVDGQTVQVAPEVRSSEAVAAAVRPLLADPAYRVRLAEHGRRLGERHGWPQVVSGHRAVYESVLGRRDG